MSKKSEIAVAAGAGVATGAGAAIGYQAWKRAAERDMVDGRPAELRRLDPSRIKADPEVFQFKSGGDEKGVTDRLKSVAKWNPVAAGKAMVFERADGSHVIADGHQRLGLAQRLMSGGEKGIKLDAYVLRERDGWTARDVRAYAAIKNMHESSGQALDMAKVMRERPDLVTKSMPISDQKVQDAKSLAKLSDAAFRAVVGGVVKPEYAAAVGESVNDSHRHEGLIKEMAKAGIGSAQHARLFVGQAMAAPSITEHTGSLFGEETNTRSLLKERAAVLDKALQALKTDKKIFGLLEREAGTIEAVGNKLSHAANVEKAEGAGRTAALIEKLATTRGPVSDMIDRAARAVAEGKKPAAAAREFVKQVGVTLKSGGINALTGSEPRMQEMIGSRPWQRVVTLEDIAAAKEKIKGTSPEAEAKWGKILDALPSSGADKKRADRSKGEALNKGRVQRMEDDMFGGPSTKDKIAAASRAQEAKGRTGDPMTEGLFGSSSKQTDLVEMAKKAPSAPAGLTADSRYKFVGESRTLERGPVNVYMDKVSGVHVVAYRNGAFDTSGSPLGARQAPSGIEMAAAAANPEARFHASASKITDHVEFRPAEGLKGTAGWSDAAREASADARKADPHAAERERIANGTKRIGDTYKAPATAAPTAADKFTSGMKPMAAAKAKAALETQVRHNRNEFLTRAALVERQIANGASVQTMKIGGKEQRVLMGKDGAFLDSRAITKAGLDYAEHLSAMKPSNPNYTPGVGTTQEGYWSHKSPPTPTVNELPPGAFSGTQRDFESMSPGMRREIKRAADLEAIKQKTRDALGPNGDGKVRRTDGSPIAPEPAKSVGTLKMMGIPADGSKPFVMAIMDSPGSLAEQQAKAAKNFEQNAKHYTQKLSGYELHDSSGKVVGWSDEARAASAEVRGEKAMAKNPVSEAERAGRINRLRNRAGAGGIEGAAADRFVSENLAKLEALDAKRAAMNKATADVPTIAPAEKFKGTPIPAKAETAIKAYDDAKGSGLRGTQNEANREAIIKNRKANAAPPDSPAGQAARYAKKAGMKAPVFRSAVNDHLAAKGLPALPKNAALDKVGAHLEKHLGGTGAHGLMGDLVQGKFAPPAAKPRSNVDLVRNLQATAMGAKRQVFPDAATGQKTGQPVAEKPATTANPAGQKTGAGKKALGLLAPVAIGAGALIAMNQSAKAGESKVDQLKTGSIEAVKGTGVLAGFAAGTAVVAKGFMKLGMTAAKAAPATQAVLMAGGAIHGAATAKPGERMKGAAKGAWDMSLPGMVVNTGIAVKEAVKSTADRAPVNGRISDQQAKAYASASARFATMRGAAQETDGTAKAKGWSNAARIGAYQARAAKNGFDPTNMPYGGKPENGPDKWQGKKG
jgi:hypothetical protein